MTPDRWRQIEELFRAAIDLREEERSAGLGRATREIRAEVEAMLAQPAGSVCCIARFRRPSSIFTQTSPGPPNVLGPRMKASMRPSAERVG